MSGRDPDAAITALNRRFLLDYPWDAARQIEQIDRPAAAAALAEQAPTLLPPVWRRLLPNVAAELLEYLPESHVRGLLNGLLPHETLRFLTRLPPEGRDHCLQLAGKTTRFELELLLQYPEDSAGRIMDARCSVFRTGATAALVLEALRSQPARTARSLFLVDEQNRLIGRVAIQGIATADPQTTMGALSSPLVASVHPLSSQEEVAELIERYRLADLPVIDAHGVPVGVIYHSDLVQAVREEASSDIQAMVGASRAERALSPPWFAVRRRLPWLQINLLTAFLAASVVGLFENTIARFTALAVLMPVVAGQAGNAGAQALAVTMRGLTLREISLRQWLAVTTKELSVGFANGLATALTCGVGVYLWSRSLGLVLIISVSMVLAMIAAGFAGAIVPIVLTRLGQDPAQSSSIVLTTITDVCGFFSFLGIATLLSRLL